jgi:hypothetical protein
MFSARRRIRKLTAPPKAVVRIVALWLASLAGLLLLVLFLR